MLRTIEQFIDAQFLTMVFAAIAAGATVLTLAMPLLARDTLSMRMKAVAFERERIRLRERERLAQGNKVTLRQSPRAYMNTVVQNFNLSKWVGEEKARLLLVQAGYRGHAPYVTYLFFRMVMPIAMLLLALFYVFVVIQLDQPTLIKLGIGIGAAYFGMLSPNLYLKNKITRRQASIKRAFPDALDLLLICIESGMSVEAAFQKVSDEVGAQSVELAEELTLTTAELSYLPDRRQAYDNLAQRVGLEGVKAVCLALQQAERYGTPLGTTMRVLAQENRDMRMSEAEKKAAALPPKLTVPMILFFLPVLFVVILGPGRHQGDGNSINAGLSAARRVSLSRLPRGRSASFRASLCDGRASASDKRRWRRLRPPASRRGRCFQLRRSGLAGRSTSAKFCRTRGSTGCCAAARRSVASASRRFFDSA